MKKKILLILIFLILPWNILFADEVSPTVYSSEIWLSKDIFFDGEKIRIYSKFKNKENFDIQQTIEFYDNNILIGEKKIEIASKRDAVIWIDTSLSSGKHRIISKTKEIYKDLLSVEKEKINSKTISNLKIIEIDKDSDGDGIGDKIDPDDDNDGFSDVVELEEGSDPKSKLSTPKIEKAKKTVEDITNKTKSITSSLIEVLTEKRESIKRQLDKTLSKENKYIEKTKNNIATKVSSYNIQSEIDLIREKSNETYFNKNKNEKIKIFNNIDKIEDVLKKTKDEINKINNQKLSKSERDFSKACLFQAKYEKIKVLSSKEDRNNLWNKIWIFIILILSFIFKNNFLTIIFFILLFWLFWKIIKRF